MALEITYDGDPDEDRPEASVERFRETKPVMRPESAIGANAAYPAWPLAFERSRWFEHGELLRLEPGEYTNFVTHTEAQEGPYERYYRVFSGEARLLTARRGETLQRFDAVFVPPDCPHQFGNVGTKPLWIGGFAPLGGETPAYDWARDPAERPGARETYERVLATRAARDLPLPPDVDSDGDVTHGEPQGGASSDVQDAEWSSATVRRFDETIPVTFHEAEETGCNADRQEWYTLFPESNWFYAGVMLRLDPGEYLDFHTHRANEGPYEELYWVVDGTAHLQTEYWDTTLEAFDCAFFPTGCAHNFGNAGTEPLWFEAWMSHGGDAPSDVVPDHLEPVERPGAVEEYERIMAARQQRGLSIPPGVEVELADD